MECAVVATKPNTPVHKLVWCYTTREHQRNGWFLEKPDEKSMRIAKGERGQDKWTPSDCHCLAIVPGPKQYEGIDPSDFAGPFRGSQSRGNPKGIVAQSPGVRVCEQPWGYSLQQAQLQRSCVLTVPELPGIICERVFAQVPSRAQRRWR